MTTTCEEVLEAVSAEGTVPEALAPHVLGCEACREAIELLKLAALPPPRADELAALAASSGELLKRWQQQQPLPAVVPLAPRRAARSALVRQVGQFALAAGLGAVIASAVLLKKPVQVTDQPITVQPVVLEVPALPDQTFDDPNLPDDEVFFDVSWPTEGDL